MRLSDDLRIIGGPSVAPKVLGTWLAKHTPWTASNQAGGDLIVACYTAYGQLSGLGNLLPFAQGCHETGHFTSEWWVRANNPAGIGVTGQAGMGEVFASPALGILAHIAHLLAYASADKGLTTTQRILTVFTPRLGVLEKAHYRGVAPRWADLGAKWAVSAAYGTKLLRVAEVIAGENALLDSFG